MGNSQLNATESSEPSVSASVSAFATRRRATVLLSAILVPLGVVTLVAMVLAIPLTTLIAVLVVKAVGPRTAGVHDAGSSDQGATPAVLATEGAGTLAPGERLVALGGRRARCAAETDA